MIWIPNALSLLNLAMGVCSIFFSLSGQFLPAAWVILIGMLADFLDGKVARAINKPNPIGGDLDSLSDIVSFGVAPAAFFYSAFTFHSAGSFAGLYPDNIFLQWELNFAGLNFLALAVSLIWPLCASYRLAKFNVSEVRGRYVGIPTTTATGGMIMLMALPALPISFFPWIAVWLEPLNGFVLPWWIILPLFMLYSYQMVSNFHYSKVPKLFTFKGNWLVITADAAFLVGILFMYKYVLALGFFIYFIIPIITWKRAAPPPAPATVSEMN